MVIDNTNLLQMCRDCGAVGFIPEVTYEYDAGAAEVTVTNASTIPAGDTLNHIRIQVHDMFGGEVRGRIEGVTAGAVGATATVTITAVGADGDEIKVYAPEALGGALLGEFEKTAAETTVTLLADALRAAINALTGTHGYSATNVAGVITVTAPTALGDDPNTLELTVDDGGTITATDTAFAGGVTGTSATEETIDVSTLDRSKPLAIRVQIFTNGMIAADGGAYGLNAAGDIGHWDVQKNA